MTPTSDTTASGLVIARVGGVPVVIGASWLILAAVVTILVASSTPQLGRAAYLLGFGYAVALLISVLVHESAHAVVARLVGLPVHAVVADLWGGHTTYDASDATPANTAAIAVAGPAANVAVGLLAFAGSTLLSQGMPARLMFALAAMNGLLAAFNMLPGLPLDGGQLVDALVWKLTGRRSRGLIAAGWTGRLVTIGVVVWFVARPLLSGASLNLTPVIWMVLVGGFMWQGATAAIRGGQAREMLARGRVRDVVTTVPVLRYHDLLTAIAPSGGTAVVVDDAGMPVGLLSPDDASRVPESAWSSTPVSALARIQPESWVAHTAADADLEDLVLAVRQSGLQLVVAVEDSRVLGVVTVAALNQALTGG